MENEGNIDLFLQGIENNMKSIDDNFKNVCDLGVSLMFNMINYNQK